jgi:molybdenum cofactor cytidylyltransferase
MRAPKLNILVLAAGLSTRLGTPKPLVRIRGVSLLRRALVLGASLSPHKVFAVVPSRSSSYRQQAAGLSSVCFISNPKRADGLATSVRIGIRRARFAGAILILPVDLYALESRDLVRLLARWSAMPGRSAATQIGAHGGVPLILPARQFPAASQLEGDTGLRNLLSQFTPGPVLVDLPAAALDIDTLQDLRAARLRWRRPCLAALGATPKRKIAKHL